MRLVLVLGLLGAVRATQRATSYLCKTDADCEMLGACSVDGVCHCNPGFIGPSCGSVNLSSVSSCPSCFPLWPTPQSRQERQASAWGFSALYDPADQLWHAFVTVACNGSGVIADGGGNSWIGHVVSTAPDREFSLIGMVTPQTTFGPHVSRAPDGTFVLVFRVNVLLNATLCGGNGSDPLPPSWIDDAYIPPYKLHSGDPEAGTSIWIAWAPRMTGPWEVVQTNITGAGDVHKSNPSLAFLADGRVLMAYRYNPPGGELLAFAFAANNDFRGPYVNVFNLTQGRPGDEDPGAWQQPDGSLHVLYHNKGFGYHAFATDSTGKSWAVSPTGSHAFTLAVSLNNGTATTLLRRERPELRLSASTGLPLALINGVLDEYGTAFSMSQPVALSVQ